MHLKPLFDTKEEEGGCAEDDYEASDYPKV
jgi:hypothetical protein